LSGFCCEITPHGAYIWKFVYPLFDKFECISLLYSHRLDHPEGYINFDEIDKKELATEFLSRVDKYIEDAYSYLTLDQFCDLYIEEPSLLEHEVAEMVLGYSMTLLGKKESAIKHLTNASANVGGYLREPALSECKNILSIVQSDIDIAQREILKLEQKMKKSIGLKSDS